MVLTLSKYQGPVSGFHISKYKLSLMKLTLNLGRFWWPHLTSSLWDRSKTQKRDEIYRVDYQGRVTGKFQKFVNGYCLIYPYFYPYDRHICLISIFYRTDFSHSYRIKRWSVSSTANLFHPRWDIIGSLVQLWFSRPKLYFGHIYGPYEYYVIIWHTVWIMNRELMKIWAMHFRKMLIQSIMGTILFLQI